MLARQAELRRRAARRVRRAGMTLIEVLVSSILLGIGVTGLLSSATLAMRNQQRAEHRSAAVYLAQEMLAQVDAMGAHTWALGQPTTGTEQRGDLTLRWTLSIEQTSVAELFRVGIRVDWAAAAGEGTVEFETLLNDYEAASLLASHERNQQNQPNQQQPQQAR